MNLALAAAVAAIALPPTGPGRPPPTTAPNPCAPQPRSAPGRPGRAPASANRAAGLAPLLLVAALTGLSSFIYEIVWIRMLGLVLGSSTHAFELMLSSFILGLALGGYWIKSRIDHVPDMMRYLATVQIVMGVLLATLPVYNEMYDLACSCAPAPPRQQAHRCPRHGPRHLHGRHDPAPDHLCCAPRSGRRASATSTRPTPAAPSSG
jgi:hypothetical protein